MTNEAAIDLNEIFTRPEAKPLTREEIKERETQYTIVHQNKYGKVLTVWVMAIDAVAAMEKAEKMTVIRLGGPGCGVYPGWLGIDEI